MASIHPGAPQEEILRELTQQAKALWGNDRAEALRDALEQTAGQLREVSQAPPRPEVEPGFYQ